MDNFNLARMRNMLPKDLPRMPSWPAAVHRSMNPDEDGTPASKNDAEQSEIGNDGNPALSPMDPHPLKSGPKSSIDILDEVS